MTTHKFVFAAVAMLASGPLSAQPFVYTSFKDLKGGAEAVPAPAVAAAALPPSAAAFPLVAVPVDRDDYSGWVKTTRRADLEIIVDGDKVEVGYSMVSCRLESTDSSAPCWRSQTVLFRFEALSYDKATNTIRYGDEVVARWHDAEKTDGVQWLWKPLPVPAGYRVLPGYRLDYKWVLTAIPGSWGRTRRAWTPKISLDRVQAK